MENRSVPPDTILPHIAYPDVTEAAAWLTRVFGFSEHYRYGNPTSGMQMHLGNAWIMLRKAPASQATPAHLGFGTQSLTIFVPDVDAHHHHAQSAGATIVEPPNETIYGEYQYGVRDLAGHHWLFARHAHDISPSDWGATIATPTHP